MRARERWRVCNVPVTGQIAVGCVTGDEGISSNHSARRNRVTYDEYMERLKGVLVQTRTMSGERGQRAESGERGEERRGWIAKSDTGNPWACKPKNPNAHLSPATTTNTLCSIQNRFPHCARHHGRSIRRATPPSQSSIASTTADRTCHDTSGHSIRRARLQSLHPCSHTSPTNLRLPAQ